MMGAGRAAGLVYRRASGAISAMSVSSGCPMSCIAQMWVTSFGIFTENQKLSGTDVAYLAKVDVICRR
jgi:hypothetical protein